MIPNYWASIPDVGYIWLLNSVFKLFCPPNSDEDIGGSAISFCKADVLVIGSSTAFWAAIIASDGGILPELKLT